MKILAYDLSHIISWCMIYNNQIVFDFAFDSYLFTRDSEGLIQVSFYLNTISWHKLETCVMNSSPDNYIVIVPTQAFKYFCYNFHSNKFRNYNFIYNFIIFNDKTPHNSSPMILRISYFPNIIIFSICRENVSHCFTTRLKFCNSLFYGGWFNNDLYNTYNNDIWGLLLVIFWLGYNELKS